MKDIIRVRQIIWSVVLVLRSILGIFLITHVFSIVSDTVNTPVLPFWVLIIFQLLPMLLIYNDAILLIRTKRSTGFKIELTESKSSIQISKVIWKASRFFSFIAKYLEHKFV